jgi:hypothetical protein
MSKLRLAIPTCIMSLSMILGCSVMPRTDCNLIDSVISQIMLNENGKHLMKISNKEIPILIESTLNINWHFEKYRDKHKLVMINRTQNRALTFIDSIPDYSFISRDTFTFQESKKVAFNYYEISPLFRKRKDYYVMEVYFSNIDQSITLYSFRVNRNCDITDWKRVEYNHNYSY